MAVGASAPRIRLEAYTIIKTVEQIGTLASAGWIAGFSRQNKCIFSSNWELFRDLYRINLVDRPAKASVPVMCNALLLMIKRMDPG